MNAATMLDELLRRHREDGYDFTYADLADVSRAMDQPLSGQSAAPAAAIHDAIDILTTVADGLQESHTLAHARDDWTGEPEAKGEYDRILLVAAALRAQPVQDTRDAALEEAAQACERREARADNKGVQATCRLCAKEIRALKVHAVVNQSLTTEPASAAPAQACHPDTEAVNGIAGWEAGMRYNPDLLKAGRRRVDAARSTPATEKGDS